MSEEEKEILHEGYVTAAAASTAPALVGNHVQADPSAASENKNETPDSVLAEIRSKVDEIRALYPDVKINVSVDQHTSLADLQKVRDQVVDVKRAEEAKEIQKTLMGGAVGAAIGGALVTGALKDPSILKEDIVNPDGKPKNARFDELLSVLGSEDKKLFGALGGGKSIGGENYGDLKVDASIPDLMAASRNAELASPISVVRRG